MRKELSGEEIFSKKKAKLAEIGTSVLENPEANVKSLKELLEICEDEDHRIVKLALLSMLAIFKDIIPGFISPLFFSILFLFNITPGHYTFFFFFF